MSFKNYIYKNTPSKYLLAWKDYLVPWLSAFLSKQSKTGRELAKLDNLLHPFLPTRMNRFFALDSRLDDSDLVIISDMVRGLQRDVTLTTLVAMAYRVSDLTCRGSIAYNGTPVDPSGGLRLDSGYRLDEGSRLTGINFPYYIELMFNLNSDDIPRFKDSVEKLQIYLSVYKPVRLDVVVECRINVNSYDIDYSVIDDPTLDAGFKIDSGVTLDYTIDMKQSIRVYIDNVEVGLSYKDEYIYWKAPEGGVIRVEFLGRLLTTFNLIKYPAFSLADSWICVLDTDIIANMIKEGLHGYN